MARTRRLTSLWNRSTGAKVAMVAAALLVVCLVVIAGFVGLGTALFYDSYQSSYGFEASVDVDGATENVVVLLPIGVHDGEAVVDELYVADSDRFVGVSHEVVATDRGPMLRIEIDEVREGRDTLWFDSRITSDWTIDTRTPRGTEPVLAPVELSDPERGADDHDDWAADRWPDYRSFEATSPVYVEHGGDDITFGVIVRYEGTNEWWTFGWSWNTYETSVAGDIAGTDPGGEWVELRGWHTEGVGSYPRFPPTPS